MEVKEGGLGNEGLQQLDWWHSLCVSSHVCVGGGRRLLQVLVFTRHPPWLLRQHLSLASCLPKKWGWVTIKHRDLHFSVSPATEVQAHYALWVLGLELKVNSLAAEPSTHPICVPFWKPDKPICKMGMMVMMTITTARIVVKTARSL